MSTIPFDEIVPGATARFVVVDGIQYLSIRDVLVFVCALTPKRANEKWNLLSDSIKNELTEYIGQFRFPGPGNPSPSPVITFQGVLKLTMLVSGEKAALYRSSMVKILQRYYSGDGTLVNEIEANAVSNSPIAQMARAADGEGVPPKLKRSMECDGGFYDLDVDERKAKIALMIAAAHLKTAEASLKTAEANSKNVDSHKELLETYVSVCTHPVLDDAAKAAFKANVMNIIRPVVAPPAASLLAIANHQEAGADDLINISGVAADMGLQFSIKDLKAIGCLLSKAYNDKYNVKPNQREQQVATGKILVNSYTNRDLDLMQAAISDFDKTRGQSQSRICFAPAAGHAAGPAAGPA